MTRQQYIQLWSVFEMGGGLAMLYLASRYWSAVEQWVQARFYLTEGIGFLIAGTATLITLNWVWPLLTLPLWTAVGFVVAMLSARQTRQN